MTQLADLLRHQAALTREIEEFRQADRGRAIDEIRRLMAEYRLSPKDVVGRAVQTKPADGKIVVAVKYRDPETCATWTGRGLTPRWLAARLAEGKSKEDFAV